MSTEQSDQDPNAQAGGYGSPTVEDETGAEVPSADAPMDESNTEKPRPERSFSSEADDDAAAHPEEPQVDEPS